MSVNMEQRHSFIRRYDEGGNKRETAWKQIYINLAGDKRMVSDTLIRSLTEQLSVESIGHVTMPCD